MHCLYYNLYIRCYKVIQLLFYQQDVDLFGILAEQLRIRRLSKALASLTSSHPISRSVLGSNPSLYHFS